MNDGNGVLKVPIHTAAAVSDLQRGSYCYIQGGGGPGSHCLLSCPWLWAISRNESRQFTDTPLH